MKHIDKLIGILLLLFAIGFNLWIYRQEPTAQTDPNDNTFQFALVERTNQIWDFAVKKCSSNYLTFGLCHLSFLVDHWVPNWAQGYNLPYYYSHVPQIFIVASWRLVSSTIQQFSNVTISLYSYYHFVIYILLSLFPLSLFIGLRIIGVSWLASGFGALIATQLSTDGLYGLDLSSFLWRGWGLSSQLFAMIWLPLAIAYGWKWLHVQKETNMRTERQGAKFSQDGSELRFQENFRHPERSFKHQRVLLFAILFLAATTAGHLGIGIIAFLSVGILSLSNLSHLGNLSNLKEILKKLLLLYGGVFLLLGYWIFPILLGGNYHNISVWDSIWKFDSFGYREVLKNLFNGDLFDFGRLPILTTLAFIGLFSGLFTIYHLPFTILFLFWLLLYFGRTTWGGLFNLIPGMSEFHLSRFIVGIHIAGLFLIPIGFEWLMEQVLRITYFVLGKRNSTIIPDTNRLIRYLITGVTLAILFPIISGQTLRYSKHNDFLIKRANENYEKDKEDVASLLSVVRRQLSEKSGRVFAGRGGSWGRNLRIAETPIYMHLSTYGIPVILWLPETWSPNSDTEQYFSENNPAHYALYNVRYVVTPTDLPKEHIQPFWRLLESGKSWRLYEVSPLSPQSPLSPLGYITTGVRPAIVSTSKTDYRSLVRLWMHSDYPSQDGHRW